MQWQELLLINAALKTKLLQNIAAKPQTAEELASSNGYDMRAVELVMEALRELGLVGRNRAYYEIRPAASKYIDENDPSYSANSLLHSARLIENWTKLDTAIKTGKSQSRRRSATELEVFVRAMDEYSRGTAKEIISLLMKEKPQAKSALDVGGALGTYSKLLADKGVAVTLLDTQAIIELAKKYFGGVAVKLVAGDFNQALPEDPFDIILLSNITHIYNPDKIEALFSRAEEQLSAGGVVGIVDLVREKSSSAAMFGVNMLIHTAGGGTWTLPQYKHWLRHAGLKLKSVKDLKNADQKLLIAERIKE